MCKERLFSLGEVASRWDIAGLCSGQRCKPRQGGEGVRVVDSMVQVTVIESESGCCKLSLAASWLVLLDVLITEGDSVVKCSGYKLSESEVVCAWIAIWDCV